MFFTCNRAYMERPEPSSLPTTPGVYLYKDTQGRILYVGKARNLRKRVVSYFRTDVPRKTAAMLGHAATLETLSTGTEKEALLLEASLIKRHRPHYNIVLRDDKQYVLFRLNRNEPYPRLEIVRQARKDGARYFGPFTSGLAARETWKALHRAFPLRRCADRAFKNRVRPCLYHHLGQCLGPCVLEIPREDYAALTHGVELFLAGRSRELVQQLEEAMLAASAGLEFEKAAVLRDQIKAVTRTVERQSVVLPEGGDMDVAGVAPVRDGLGLGLLFVREGKLVDGRTFFWPGLTLEDGPELVWSFLSQYYGDLTREGIGTMAGAIPPKIIVPFDEPKPETLAGSPDGSLNGVSDEAMETGFRATLEAALAEARQGVVRILTPRGVSESRLVDMAASNAREAASRRDEQSMGQRLATALQAERPLERIECVDVSHTGGTETRVGIVAFEGGKPFKADYRTYTIEDAHGDDYAALYAFAMRRATAATTGGANGEVRPWPDLLLVDGGRGQLSAVMKGFQERLGVAGVPFAVAGIAKARDEDGHADRRAGNVSDRIFLPGRSNPLPLRPGSQELLFLQHVRDTAHNHVIGRHRKARAKAALTSELHRIPGVGPATEKLLWAHFPSLEAMLAASDSDLSAIPGIGPRRAAMLHEKLRGLRT